jgi:hypothetical protein
LPSTTTSTGEGDESIADAAESAMLKMPLQENHTAKGCVVKRLGEVTL